MSDYKNRAHKRLDCQIPVRIITDNGEQDGVAVNISLGGINVETLQPLAFGTKVKLRFRLPSLQTDTDVDATVRWSKDDAIGLQFGSLRAKDVWAINKLFKGG